jgi:hypothetical protein
MRILFALLLSLVCGAASAADFVVPEQKITGAESPIPLGELVDLRISPLKDKPQYLESVSYAWKVIDLSTGEEKRVREAADGIFFGAGIQAKRLKAFCAVTYLYVLKENQHVQEVGTRSVLLVADVQVGNETPNPNPQPSPSPTQDPSFTGEKLGLATLAYQSSKTIGQKAYAKTLSENFQKLTERVAKGELKVVADILAASKALNDSPPEEWKLWFVTVGDKLFELSQSGKLAQPADFAQAFAEIAAGLSAVR